MQGILHRTAPPLLQSKSKSRIVLGPSSVSNSPSPNSPPPDDAQSPGLHPKRIDSTPTTTASVEHLPALDSTVDITVEDMPVEIPAAPAPNLDLSGPAPIPVRINTEGPWSVSVAENPYDASSYSVYVKSACPKSFVLLFRFSTR